MHEHGLSDDLTDEHQSLAECQGRRDWNQWKDAMQAELDSLMKRGTFTMVPKMEGMPLIPTKWVFEIKRDEKGRTDKYKARTVVKAAGGVHGCLAGWC